MKKFNRPRQDRTQSNRPIEKDPAKVDHNGVLASFTNMMVKARPGEGAEWLVKRFKRMVESSGLMGELKKREHFKAPALKKREKRAKATKRFLKNKAEADARLVDRE